MDNVGQFIFNWFKWTQAIFQYLETYLQTIIEFPENSEFHTGVNNLWEKCNTGLITQKLQLIVEFYWATFLGLLQSTSLPEFMPCQHQNITFLGAAARTSFLNLKSNYWVLLKKPGALHTLLLHLILTTDQISIFSPWGPSKSTWRGQVLAMSTQLVRGRAKKGSVMFLNLKCSLFPLHHINKPHGLPHPQDFCLLHICAQKVKSTQLLFRVQSFS